MSPIEKGLKRSISGLIEGFLVSTVVNVFVPILGETGQLLSIAVRLLSINSAIMLFEKMKYWSLSYISGYFLGLLFFGKFFIEEGELQFYILIIAVVIIKKILKK